MANSFKAGAWGQTDAIEPLILFRANLIGATERVSSLQARFDNVNSYIVPSGKILYITKMVFTGCYNSAAYLKLGYCDNDVGFGSLFARTNAVMSIGVDDANNNGLAWYNNMDATMKGQSLRNLEFTNLFIKMAIGGKYPFVHFVSGFNCFSDLLLWGLEV